MSDRARYPVPAARHRTEATIERSRFLCTIARVSTSEDAQLFVREMNAEFADATHNCWAYVIGAPGNTSRIGMSDAGEPHGTAGRPMLTVLLHSGVGDIAAVVTRYYGGTKLGTGGLVKAYSGAVQLALATLPRVERIEWIEITVGFSYTSITAVRQLLSTYEAEVIAEEYGNDVQFLLRVPESQAAALRSALLDATRGQMQLRETVE
ncbi:MAG: YigZ family protein [Gemmatimonadaceae bacterium]